MKNAENPLASLFFLRYLGASEGEQRCKSNGFVICLRYLGASEGE